MTLDDAVVIVRIKKEIHKHLIHRLSHVTSLREETHRKFAITCSPCANREPH